MELLAEIVLDVVLAWALIMLLGWMGDVKLFKRYPHRDPNQPHCRRNPAPGWKS